MDDQGDGRAFAILDYDRDGRPDLAAVYSNAPSTRLFRNLLAPPRTGAAPREGDAPQEGDAPPAGAAPGFIAIRFVGGNAKTEPRPGFACRDGYGAQVTLQAGGRTLLREHRCGEGMAAQNSATLLIGLGPAAAAESVQVRWPSGRVTSAGTVPSGTLVTVFEDPAENSDRPFTLSPYRPPARQKR